MKTLLIITATAVLSAGGTVAVMKVHSPVQVRTVSWFVAHPDERANTRAACHDDAGKASTDPACDNAEMADMQESARDLEKANR